MPVNPHERGPDHWALVPASRDNLTADRLGSAAHSLPYCGRLNVPGPALQEMDTVDADSYLGMVAEVDQGVLRADQAAAPAGALAGLVYRCLGLSVHGDSYLLAASVGTPEDRCLGVGL